MRNISSLNQVEWPTTEISDNFSFSTMHPDGLFKFLFRYFNGRWNCWCTLPSGETRVVGVEPNVVSWSGFLDYGIVFITELPLISRNSLFLTSLYIITWE